MHSAMEMLKASLLPWPWLVATPAMGVFWGVGLTPQLWLFSRPCMPCSRIWVDTSHLKDHVRWLVKWDVSCSPQ